MKLFIILLILALQFSGCASSGIVHEKKNDAQANGEWMIYPSQDATAGVFGRPTALSQSGRKQLYGIAFAFRIDGANTLKRLEIDGRAFSKPASQKAREFSSSWPMCTFGDAETAGSSLFGVYVSEKWISVVSGYDDLTENASIVRRFIFRSNGEFASPRAEEQAKLSG